MYWCCVVFLNNSLSFTNYNFVNYCCDTIFAHVCFFDSVIRYSEYNCFLIHMVKYISIAFLIIFFIVPVNQLQRGAWRFDIQPSLFNIQNILLFFFRHSFPYRNTCGCINVQSWSIQSQRMWLYVRWFHVVIAHGSTIVNLPP